MSITVNEYWGDSPRTGSIDANGFFQYTKNFKVQTTDKWIGPGQVMTASGIPLYLSTYYERNAAGSVVYTDSDSVRIGVTARQIDSSNAQIWEVICNYGQWQYSENPLADPPAISWAGANEEFVPLSDLSTGYPIQNSAGDPFDPPYTQQRSYSVMTYSVNVASYDESVGSAYRDTVNNGTWYGVPAGHAKIASISATASQTITTGSGTITFCTMTVEVWIRSTTWQPSLLDQGLNLLSSGVISPITQRGVPVTEPLLLDGTGVPLGYNFTTYKYDQKNVTPVSLNFTTFQTANFSALMP